MSARAHHLLAAYVVSSVVLATVLFAGVSHAQTETSPIEGSAGSASAMPENTVSCFDHYSFGSVSAQIAASSVSVVSGSSLEISGTLVNENVYPIVDGALHVKVFKKRSQNDANGPDVVDQFLVKDQIAIPANGSIPVSFTWNVPSYAQSGEYLLATFFTTSHKFSLSGLLFTDDVIGNSVPFTVVGEQGTGVAFDRAGAKINGKDYHFVAFPPQVSMAEPVVISARIVNSTPADQEATVSWTVAHWDDELRQSIVQEKKETVTVFAKSSKVISIDVTDNSYPVYSASAVLTWKDTRSVIDMRFVREGIDRPRMNFPGVMLFPLRAGQSTTLFSCLHNMGSSVVPDGRLEIMLSEQNGTPIHSYVYTGAITPNMMGVADRFVPERTHDVFRLDARLYQGDRLVDETQIVYDCNAIDPALCTPQSNLFTIILAAGGVILLLVVLVWIERRLSHRQDPAPTQAQPQIQTQTPPKV